MKLQRIALQNVRMFRAPVVLEGLEPGLNVFSGPNGTGKSTLVEAIRAAFLERYKSGAVDHLRPRDASGVAPAIQLDFTIAGTPYHLEKSFLATKRCSLSYARETLDGEDAEDYLASSLAIAMPGVAPAATTTGASPAYFGSIRVPGRTFTRRWNTPTATCRARCRPWWATSQAPAVMRSSIA